MEILFRCSGNGDIMTEPQAKADKDAGKLSATAITRCIQIYLEQCEGRYKELDNKYIRKGNNCEQDSVDLLSLVERKMYRQNTERRSNELITGLPDLVTDIIEDIKTCWDRETFLKTKFSQINKDYFWQGQGYMSLFDKQVFKLRYCLVNATADELDREKYYAKTEEKKQQIERNMIFDIKLFREQNPDYHLSSLVSEWTYDVPAKDRIFTIEIARDYKEIERMYAKLRAAKEWIKTNLIG